jgi:large subunit ribosomal protein L9
MKVILQQNVKDQGKSGQMVEVSDGYARNYLFPRKLAVPATTESVAKMKQQEAARLRRIEKEKALAREIAEKLEGIIVKVSGKSGGAGKLFGSVTSMEVAESLEAQHGIAIEKNKIQLAEHIKTYGSYDIKVKLGHEISGTIHLLVTE